MTHAVNCALASRPFAAVYTIHGAGAYTKEWNKVVHTKTDFKQATPDYWAAQAKLHEGQPLLCVCDDMNWQDLNPKERNNTYKLVQFVATHMNVTTSEENMALTTRDPQKRHPGSRPQHPAWGGFEPVEDGLRAHDRGREDAARPLVARRGHPRRSRQAAHRQLEARDGVSVRAELLAWPAMVPVTQSPTDLYCDTHRPPASLAALTSPRSTTRPTAAPCLPRSPRPTCPPADRPQPGSARPDSRSPRRRTCGRWGVSPCPCQSG